MPDRPVLQPYGLWLSLALALLLLALLTGLAPVLYTDSFAYLECASNVAAGNGPRVSRSCGPAELIAHWPPLYPALMGAMSRLTGLGVESAALVLSAITLGVTLALMGRWLSRRGVTSGARTLALLALAVQPDLLINHACVCSEGLFLSVLMGCLLLADQYRVTGSARTMACAAALAGVASLARYAGLALAPFGVILILLSNADALRDGWRRLRHGLVWITLAILPLATWWLWSSRHSGRSARTLAWHPVGGAEIRQGLESLSGYLFSPLAPWPAGLVALAALWFLMRRATPTAGACNSEAPEWLTAGPLFALVYVSFLLATISVADHKMPLDSRLLLPAALALVPSAVAALDRVARHSTDTRRARWVAVGAALLALSWLAQTGYWIHRNYTGGLGYARHRRNSTVLEEVCQQDSGRPVYSNVAAYVRHYCGRPACTIPNAVDPYSIQRLDNYEAEWEAMVRDLQTRDGLVAYWAFRGDRPYEITLDDLTRKIPLEELSRDASGSLHRWRVEE